MFLIYTRRSTDDADNQKNSLEHQEKACRRYARDHKLRVSKDSIEGFVSGGIIKEMHSGWKSLPISISGAGLVEYQIERPKFMQMIPLLLQKKYDGVIVLCWDRISRNDNDDLIIKDLIDNKQMSIKFVEADYDHKSSAGKLHRNVDGMVAQYWSDKTSEALKKTHKKLRSEGKYANPTPIGYLDYGSDNKTIDPVRGPIVLRLYELYATSEWSISQLTKWAVEQGLTSKLQHKSRTKEQILGGIEKESMPKVENPVGRTTVEKILKNPFYLGKIKDIETGEWVYGGHPPLLVDEDGRANEILFYTVQSVLRSQFRGFHTTDKEVFAFRKMIRCSCGRSYSPYRSKKNNEVYYQLKCKNGCDNTVRNLHERVITEEVQKIIEQIHFSNDELREIEDGMEDGLKKVTNERDKKTEDLHRKRREVLADLSYLRDNKISILRKGVMSPEEWLQQTADVSEKLEAVEQEQASYNETEKDMVEFVINFSELIKEAGDLYKMANQHERQRLTDIIFSELVISKGKLKEYTAKPSFAVLLDRHNQNDYSGGPGWS